MTIETPTLRHVVHTYEVFAEFEGHEYFIAAKVKREKGRTTYSQILAKSTVRKWFGEVEIPKKLQTAVNKVVRNIHLKSK